MTKNRSRLVISENGELYNSPETETLLKEKPGKSLYVLVQRVEAYY